MGRAGAILPATAPRNQDGLAGRGKRSPNGEHRDLPRITARSQASYEPDRFHGVAGPLCLAPDGHDIRPKPLEADVVGAEDDELFQERYFLG
jgi:hypothetical protein